MARVHDNLARLRVRDIEALTAASVALTEAAATIERSTSAWKHAVLQLMRSANETIIEQRDRGLSRINAFLAHQDDRADGEARARQAAADAHQAPQIAPPGWGQDSRDAGKSHE
jgi:C4-dicarboxylate-specific signal transduction histidine kinase